MNRSPRKEKFDFDFLTLLLTFIFDICRGPEFVDKNLHFFGGGSRPELMTDSFSGLQMERIKFKTWRDNLLIKSLVCALILFVLIVIFVVIIHNSIF